MSMTEARRLDADLTNDEALRARIEETAKDIADQGKASSETEALVMAAASLGYDVSVSDAERAAADDEELSLDELSSVAGGGLFDKCGVLWHCVMANM